MRTILPPHIERGRFVDDPEIGTDTLSGPDGVFLVRGPEGVHLRILSSSADMEGSEGWDHVSISTASRVPTWSEMCFVKDGFFEDEEAVIQLHPPVSTYVNNHPFVLHLWRDTITPMRLPNPIFVGIKADGTYRNVEEARAGRERAIANGLLTLDGMRPGKIRT